MTEEHDTIAGCPVAGYDFFAGDRAPLAGFAEFDELANRFDPIFRTEQGQGYYVTTKHSTVLAGLQDPQTFSSVASIPTEPDPNFALVPLHLDPPVHTQWRRQLGGYFSPGRVDQLTPRIQARARELIEALAGRGSCDYLIDFARLYPTSIFLEILGLPAKDLPMFMAWEDAMLHGTSESDPGRVKATQAAQEVSGFFAELLASGADRDGDDLISDIGRWRIDGERPDPAQLVSCLLLLFSAGLDTVATQLGYATHHLATHPDDRRIIAADSARIPQAVEEMLRAFPIVVLSRKATRDTEIGGCPVRAGDMVVFPLAAAGRDQREYERAEQVDFERGTPRHISFGAGPHRCLGSHLARREMIIALEEWHRLIPEYELGSGDITEHSGGVFGLDRLPVRWSTS